MFLLFSSIQFVDHMNEVHMIHIRDTDVVHMKYSEITKVWFKRWVFSPFCFDWWIYFYKHKFRLIVSMLTIVILLQNDVHIRVDLLLISLHSVLTVCLLFKHDFKPRFVTINYCLCTDQVWTSQGGKCQRVQEIFLTNSLIFF